MKQDPLLRLVDSSLSLETHTFLRSIVQLALLSPDPKSILNRFMVQRVTHCKDRSRDTQHDIILLQLIDTHGSGSQPPLYMRLERTVFLNQPPPPPSYFTDHPDNAIVLASMLQTLEETPVDRHHTPPSTYQTIGESEPLLTSPILPFFDAASPTATEAIFASLSSTSEVYEADDRFTGAKNADVHAAPNVRQIGPQSLSLFEFAVLADSVHKHDPLYSTLRNRSYWFASTICDVIAKEYACTVVTGKQDPVTSDDIFIPPNNYRPDLAGRRIKILVGRVKETVATVIASNFRKYLREKRKEVRFIVYPEPYILKPRYRYETDGTSII
jgi:hypothetical protein